MAGEIIDMPGLPKKPSAELIDIDENGVITTNVYNPNTTVQNRELNPVSLNEVLHEKYNNDSRTQGVV